MATDRTEQMFPTLEPCDIERVWRFGRLDEYSAGDHLVVTGQTGVGMFLILSGRVRISQHDGAGHSFEIVEYSANQFVGEVSGLSGRPALVDGMALERVEACVLGIVDKA